MFATLFVIIFVTFIGVGLPDSTLGSAWPAMYREFNLPISVAGYVSACVSAGTILASLLSDKLLRKFGVGLVTAVSTLLTAIALLGFSMTKHPAFFFILSVPLGLGAGAIDTGLNAFVALHYDAAKMSFLHCSYGLGVAVSPLIMSFALGENGDWRRGYFTVAIVQLVLTLVAFCSLPLWKRVQKKDEEERGEQAPPVSMGELLQSPKVWFACLAFFFSCSLELTAGGWSSSYFVNTKGLSADRGALMTMLFYIGLTAGRFLSGVLSAKLGRRRILRISLVTLGVALAVFFLPLPTVVGAIALCFIGFGIGPVYPNLVHLTPKTFGVERAQAVLGLQQSFACVGILIAPWLFGVLAQAFSTALLPLFLSVAFLLYAGSFFLLMARVKREKNQNKGE